MQVIIFFCKQASSFNQTIEQKSEIDKDYKDPDGRESVRGNLHREYLLLNGQIIESAVNKTSINEKKHQSVHEEQHKLIEHILIIIKPVIIYIQA